MKRRIASQSGFTLIEVVISLIVFSFLMLIFAACIPMAKKTANMNGQFAQAISLCQHKIDQMRAVGAGRLNYEELSDAGIIDDSPTTQPFSFVGVDEVDQYLASPTATVTITTVSDSVTKVTVVITWKTTGYESKTSTMTVPALIVNED